MREHLNRGALELALEDWTIRHPPPVTLFFRPKHRRTARIRLVVDFATDIFRRLEAEREQGQPPSAARPDYYYGHYGRASRAARET
jgi:hypothetical protein